jgi:uncharacterized protein YgiM (DUF1202 family)
MNRAVRGAGALRGAVRSIRSSNASRPGAVWPRRLLGLLTALLIAAPTLAETAWVKDELKLGLRTGPGMQYRIKAYVETGDSLTILSSREGWTQVRSTDHGDGWVEEGYLQGEPPAAMRLARTEQETAEFRSQFQTLKDRVGQLEGENSALNATDQEQRGEIESLTRENMELRAGARWPEWITGAGILSAGMVMGAILQGMNGRRSRPRIRL